jgi:hypothetical protein
VSVQDRHSPSPDDPAFLAGYAHVEHTMARAEASDGIGPLWRGWAVREAFWAGVQWQREQAARAVLSERQRKLQLVNALRAVDGMKPLE